MSIFLAFFISVATFALAIFVGRVIDMNMED